MTLQRKEKDVRNTCLKQWIMNALITHTSTYTHMRTQVPPHMHTATRTVTYTFSPVC